jgi:hypothetical protein
MYRFRAIFRPTPVASRRRQSLLSVGLALGLMLLAPCAVQQLGNLRAQSETNENRSEYEVNERAHITVQPSRRAATRIVEARLLVTSPQMLTSLHRATVESRLSVPGVVSWSPSMRC